MNEKEKYRKCLEPLPHIIDLQEFLKLLGNWGEAQVLQMIKNGHIRSIISPRRGHPHVFPKEYIIDFLCSDFYKKEQQKRNLKRSVNHETKE